MTVHCLCVCAFVIILFLSSAANLFGVLLLRRPVQRGKDGRYSGEDWMERMLEEEKKKVKFVHQFLVNK